MLNAIDLTIIINGLLYKCFENCIPWIFFDGKVRNPKFFKIYSRSWRDSTELLDDVRRNLLEYFVESLPTQILEFPYVSFGQQRELFRTRTIVGGASIDKRKSFILKQRSKDFLWKKSAKLESEEHEVANKSSELPKSWRTSFLDREIT